MGGPGLVITGDAAHITAAAENGPRYDADLTPADRKAAKNGIWLCKIHARQIDVDDAHFPVETLEKWKAAAELAAFEAFTAGNVVMPVDLPNLIIETEILEALGLEDQDIDVLSSALHEGSLRDIDAFKSLPGWPARPISLSLRATSTNASSFDAKVCAELLQVARTLSIVAPPGTGKSTTGIQIAEAVLTNATRIAIFISLNEWSMLDGSILASLSQRAAFYRFKERDFMLLAIYGRLTLVLDGWNELDKASRGKATAEIRRLRREFPLLELAITTRRQVVDLPVTAYQITLEPLSESEQFQLARAMSGSQGESILERAIRTPGMRALLSIPLYLSALLGSASSGRIPDTKEEILRLFIQKHEKRPEVELTLSEEFFGCHQPVLVGLAVDATIRANTAIEENRAREIVSDVSAVLVREGQLSTRLPPGPALEYLVSSHTLVRSADKHIISFQHQQIQEWYSSLAVEDLIKRAAGGDEPSIQKLRYDILNVPIWEEALLFACERVSRLATDGARSIAQTILETLSIDPVLAAEMVFRSASIVWPLIEHSIIAFINRWHKPGHIDRAVRFMLTTGRSEFANLIWPLISAEDSNVHLLAMRNVHNFRTSILGANAAQKIGQMPEPLRIHLLTELVTGSDMDGMDFAADIARSDPSSNVQFEVLQALHFRRSDRLFLRLLSVALEDVWKMLALRGFAHEIDDPQVSQRLLQIRAEVISAEPSLVRRLQMLLTDTAPDVHLSSPVVALLRSPDLPTTDRDLAWSVAKYAEHHSREVTDILLDRLARGLALPAGGVALLSSCETVDSGPISQIVISQSPKQVAEDSMPVVGIETTAELFRQYLETQINVARSDGKFTDAQREKHFLLLRLLSGARPEVFAEAWLTHSNINDPASIGDLSDVLARQGTDLPPSILKVGDLTRDQLCATCRRWTDVLITSPAASRHHLSELARAIGRIADQSLFEPLRLLFLQDLERWRASRASVNNGHSSMVSHRNEARISYTNIYRAAFASIGHPDVNGLMISYLDDLDFGVAAANVLKELHDKRWRLPHDNERIPHFLNFSLAGAARTPKATPAQQTCAEAQAIFRAVRDLIPTGATKEQQLLGVRIARIGLSIPHTTEEVPIADLVALDLPNPEKLSLFASLTQEGVVLPSELLLAGVASWLAASRERGWQARDQKWELERWLALIPFSDRPAAITEALDQAAEFALPLVQQSLMFTAFRYSPGIEAERCLVQLAYREPSLLNEFNWISALVDRGTSTAFLMLLDVLSDPAFSHFSLKFDTWRPGEAMSRLATLDPSFRHELIRVYDDSRYSACRNFIEQSLAKSPSCESLLAALKRYAAEGTGFNASLEVSIENLALQEIPSKTWPGAHEIHSLDVGPLRKSLFEMTASATAESLLAVECLDVIDNLRDEHGKPESEPRHPDIDANRPWPLVAPEGFFGERGH
jgi:hypothetical protein